MRWIRPVRYWKSPLGVACPYENRSPIVRQFFYQRFDRAVTFAALRDQATVLEIGCWQGHLLPTLLKHCSRVVAIDNDAASMIDVVGGFSTTLQLALNLCYAESADVSRLVVAKADGAELPCRDSVFDAVFCLDTLPYAEAAKKRSIIAEVARVLKADGTAVFTLPIELGPSLLVRECLRIALGTHRDRYSWHEFWSAVRGHPLERNPESYLKRNNLAGYDYRLDKTLIASELLLRRTLFLPSNMVAWIAPTILLVCGHPDNPRRQRRDEKSQPLEEDC